MTEVNLVYLAEPTRGGWPTYTAHVAHGLRAAGHEVFLWRLGKRTEDKSRPFGRGLVYRNASPEFLAEMSRHGRTHITACSFGQGYIVQPLLRAGATITIHDPTELKGAMWETLAASKEPIVVVRRAMEQHFNERGMRHRFVPHPYLPMPNPPRRVRQANAVAFSRLDWDKHTEIIVEANKELSPELAVHIFGAENRLFTYNKLTPLDADWRRNYHGAFTTDALWGGVDIALKAKWAVDMSVIKGDGGGTQYTFLEALDGGASLVLNSGWLSQQGDDYEEMKHFASFVSTASELAELLRGKPKKFNIDVLFSVHDAVTRAQETVGLA